MQKNENKERDDLKTDKIEGTRQGWDIQKLAEEASQKDADEFQRQILRGDETKGNPDNRDIAGSVKSGETPQGREETKNHTNIKSVKINK